MTLKPMQLRTIVLPLSIALFTALSAQDVPDSLNLIENGGFEQIEGKLKRPGSIEMAKGWKSPTAKKADLYSNSVADGPVSAPKNLQGDQSALNGDNYAGLRWWSYMNKEPRQYLQAKFKKMLKKDQTYCIRYYVSLSDLSKYSSDQLGSYVSRIMVKKDDESNLTYEAQVPDLRNRLYEDVYSWQGVCGTYKAKGDEQYLIIGNFAANEKTNTGKVKRPKGESRPQLTSAYYYIDDVAVYPVKSLSECKCEQIEETESEFIFSRRGAMNKSLPAADQLNSGMLYFKRYSAGIDRSQETQLNDLVELMKANPALKIRLVGHTDVSEADRVRIRPDLTDLDKDRAMSVKTAFTEAGIAPERITVAGQKAESPADQNEGEVAMSKNRRVEVKVER